MLFDASKGDVLAASLTHDVDVEAAQVSSHVPHFVVALVAHVARENLHENRNFLISFAIASTSLINKKTAVNCLDMSADLLSTFSVIEISRWMEQSIFH